MMLYNYYYRYYALYFRRSPLEKWLFLGVEEFRKAGRDLLKNKRETYPDIHFILLGTDLDYLQIPETIP